MFEKFTERARKVMSFSRQEAQRLNNDAIGTEHILLGIVREGGGVAAKVLKNLRVDFERVIKEVEKLVKTDKPSNLLGQIPFSPRAKRVIELAGESSSQLEADVIGTEHLLLGLLKENEGIAAQVLINLGLKLEEVRDMILEVLGADLSAKPSEGDKAFETLKASITKGDAKSIDRVMKLQELVVIENGSSALSSHEKAEMIVSAWLARGGQETAPNHTEHLTKMIAWAIEASRRGA